MYLTSVEEIKLLLASLLLFVLGVILFVSYVSVRILYHICLCKYGACSYGLRVFSCSVEAIKLKNKKNVFQSPSQGVFLHPGVAFFCHPLRLDPHQFQTYVARQYFPIARSAERHPP